MSSTVCVSGHRIAKLLLYLEGEMRLLGKTNFTGSYLSLFLLGTILIFFRSAYSFITPYLYAEDGSWIFELINDGFLHTFIHQRYFMTGYLILEEISIWINRLLFGFNIRHLPEVIAVVSYSFQSLIALMAFVCLKPNLSLILRSLVWLMVLLMPTGSTGFEIFGRIMNYGYMFFFIAFMLTFYLVFNASASTGRARLTAIAVILWVCSTTNAASNLILALGFLLDVLLQLSVLKGKTCSGSRVAFYLKELFGTFKFRLWLVLGIVCGICFLYQAFAMRLLGEGSTGSAVNYGNTVEFFGRAILYYFTWPFYRDLNDIYVLIMLGLFALLSVLAIMVAGKGRRAEAFYLVSGTLLIAMATFGMRPGLTSFLDGYKSTFPDCYYYVINLCAMVSVVYSAACLERCRPLGFGRFYIYALLLLPVFYSPSSIFEFNKYMDVRSLPMEVFQAQRQQDGLYLVKSNPENWFVRIPENYALSTVRNVRNYSALIRSEKCYALYSDSVLHAVYDGYDRNIWFAIWSDDNGQDDIVWGKAESGCTDGGSCYDLKLSSEKIHESPYYVHVYQGQNGPERMLCGFITPVR